MDKLVRFETFICDAFVLNQPVVAVLLNLEKVYDTTWRYDIFKDIHKLGRLSTFTASFLADCTMKARVLPYGKPSAH